MLNSSLLLQPTAHDGPTQHHGNGRNGVQLVAIDGEQVSIKDHEVCSLPFTKRSQLVGDAQLMGAAEGVAADQSLETDPLIPRR